MNRAFLLKGIILLCMFAVSYAPVYAQDKAETLASNIEQLEKEIAQYKKQLQSVAGQRVTLESTLSNQRIEAKRLSAELRLVNSKISTTEKNIGKNRITSKNTEVDVENKKLLLADSVRRLWHAEQQSIIEVWLSGATWQEIIMHGHAVDQLSSRVTGTVDQLTELLTDLDREHVDLQSEKQKLLTLQREAKEKKQLYDTQVAETAALVKRTKNQEALFQQEITQKESLRKAFEAELFAYESSLAFSFDPTKIPAPGTQPLSWPMDKIYITQRFGVTSTSGRLYQSGSHSGVDFRGNNDPVYAMADGIVEGVGDTDLQCRGASFGKWVFIRYDNGLASTFGHLALVTVREGTRVKRGQMVGYSGNTGRSTAPHLHLSLYVSYNTDRTPAVSVSTKPSLSCKGKILRQPLAPTTSYLDPLQYLPRATSAMFKPGA
jgi:murein DD-endopeptidase MepM/ murein hydrolase activator NlpD